VPRRCLAAVVATTWLVGCTVPTEPTPSPRPTSDPTAEMRPDVMFVDPGQAEPGQIVALSYAKAWDRGVLYAIERQQDGEWMRLNYMVSDANGGRPTWIREGEEPVVPAVGIGGFGPDRVPIPDGIDPGPYRICTANGVQNLCTPFEVLEGDASSGVDKGRAERDDATPEEAL
jgi:hypothetical protein